MDYNGLNVFYKRKEASGTPIVLLHGWGASADAMDGIYEFLARRNRTVYAFDFPGFGRSDMPPQTWGVYEYADCIQSLLTDLDVRRPVLIGHSFGGRVALILGARKVPSKLVLADAAGLKPKFSFRKAWRIRRYKAAKRKGKTTEGGSDDYRALPPAMRNVFVRIVNTHLDDLLSAVEAPTLLFWGEKDTETPPYMAKRMHRGIVGSGLIMMRGAGHFAYAERSDVFCAAVQSFTRE